MTTYPIKLTINITYPGSLAAAKCPPLTIGLCTSTLELPPGTASPSTCCNSVSPNTSCRTVLLSVSKKQSIWDCWAWWDRGLCHPDRARSLSAVQAHEWPGRPRVPGAFVLPLCLKFVTLTPSSCARSSYGNTPPTANAVPAPVQGPAFQCPALGPAPTHSQFPTNAQPTCPLLPLHRPSQGSRLMELVSPTLRKSELSSARGLSRPAQYKAKDHSKERTCVSGQHLPSLESSLSCRNGS